MNRKLAVRAADRRTLRHAAGLVAIIAAVALAGCREQHWMTYPWDDRTVLCSLPVDDLTLHEKWALIESQMTVAELTSSVLLLHAHTPDRSISRSALERVLKMAEIHHLAFLTFRELEPGAAPHAGLALAFDDTAIDSWFSIRDQLAAHRAHVTFFVTRWYASTEGERAELQTLADDGDDVEPHSVEHLHALQYVQDHGLDAYVADEVIPSIEVLTQAGYPAGNTFAYPFGQTTDEINDAVLRVVPRVRVSPGSCPY